MRSETLAGIRLGTFQPPARLTASGNAGRTTVFGISELATIIPLFWTPGNNSCFPLEGSHFFWRHFELLHILGSEFAEFAELDNWAYMPQNCKEGGTG